MTSNRPQRKTYRLWADVEIQLEAKAKEMNLTPAKALNVILAQVLGSPQQPEETPLPDIANHDAF